MPYPPNVRADGCRGTAAGHRLTDLRQFSDTRGSLAVIELGTEVGFPVRRVYYMYGAGAGSARGAHAHRELHQLIVAMQGSVGDPILMIIAPGSPGPSDRSRRRP